MEGTEGRAATEYTEYTDGTATEYAEYTEGTATEEDTEGTATEYAEGDFVIICTD